MVIPPGVIGENKMEWDTEDVLKGTDEPLSA